MTTISPEGTGMSDQANPVNILVAALGDALATVDENDRFAAVDHVKDLAERMALPAGWMVRSWSIDRLDRAWTLAGPQVEFSGLDPDRERITIEPSIFRTADPSDPGEGIISVFNAQAAEVAPFVFTARNARRLAAELIAAADDLDAAMEVLSR